MSEIHELDNLAVAYDFIDETIDLLNENERYKNAEQYRKILENALNDLRTVVGGIKIEEEITKNPELADTIIE